MLFDFQELVLALLTEKLLREDKNLEGYVVDGYPRTEEQLKNFTEKVRLTSLLNINGMLNSVRRKARCNVGVLKPSSEQTRLHPQTSWRETYHINPC